MMTMTTTTKTMPPAETASARGEHDIALGRAGDAKLWRLRPMLINRCPVVCNGTKVGLVERVSWARRLRRAGAKGSETLQKFCMVGCCDVGS